MKEVESYSQLQLTVVNKNLLGTIHSPFYCSITTFSYSRCYIQSFIFLNLSFIAFAHPKNNHYSFFHKIKVIPSVCFVLVITFNNKKGSKKGTF